MIGAADTFKFRKTHPATTGHSRSEALSMGKSSHGAAMQAR
jgi:hypothetical protein